jgi:hypothetical protein
VPRITSLKVDGAEFREVNAAIGMGAGAEFFTSQDFPRRVGKRNLKKADFMSVAIFPFLTFLANLECSYVILPQPAGTSHVMNPPSMG